MRKSKKILFLVMMPLFMFKVFALWPMTKTPRGNILFGIQAMVDVMASTNNGEVYYNTCNGVVIRTSAYDGSKDLLLPVACFLKDKVYDPALPLADYSFTPLQVSAWVARSNNNSAFYTNKCFNGKDLNLNDFNADIRPSQATQMIYLQLDPTIGMYNPQDTALLDNLFYVPKFFPGFVKMHILNSNDIPNNNDVGLWMGNPNIAVCDTNENCFVSTWGGSGGAANQTVYGTLVYTKLINTPNNVNNFNSFTIGGSIMCSPKDVGGLVYEDDDFNNRYNAIGMVTNVAAGRCIVTTIRGNYLTHYTRANDFSNWISTQYNYNYPKHFNLGLNTALGLFPTIPTTIAGSWISTCLVANYGPTYGLLKAVCERHNKELPYINNFRGISLNNYYGTEEIGFYPRAAFAPNPDLPIFGNLTNNDGFITVDNRKLPPISPQCKINQFDPILNQLVATCEGQRFNLNMNALQCNYAFYSEYNHTLMCSTVNPPDLND